MTRHSPFLAIALCLPLMGGCAGTFGGKVLDVVTGGSSVASVAPVTVTDTEKALTLAHRWVNFIGLQLIYNGQTVEQGGSGLLHGPLAATARTYWDKAKAALDAADEADRLLNSKDVLSHISDAYALVDKFKALGLPAPPGVTAPPASPSP